jgi:RNA polymerase sigma-70 factor (ECF subfamily)
MGNSAVDKLLYEGWVRDHARELYACALRLTNNRSLAEDLTQEAFYEAWRCMQQLQEPQRARAWLFQILRHRYLHHIRDSSRRPQFQPDPDNDDRPDHAPSVSVQLAEAESLQTALAQLSPDCRLVLVMVLLEGRTCQETADDLKIPLGTVLSRLHRARARLKSWFERDHDHHTPSPHIPADNRARESVSGDLGTGNSAGRSGRGGGGRGSEGGAGGGGNEGGGGRGNADV